VYTACVLLQTVISKIPCASATDVMTNKLGIESAIMRTICCNFRLTARLLHTSAAVVFLDAYASAHHIDIVNRVALQILSSIAGCHHICLLIQCTYRCCLLQMQTPEGTGEVEHSTEQMQSWTACPLPRTTQPWSPCNLTTTVLSSTVVALSAAAVAFYSQS